MALDQRKYEHKHEAILRDVRPLTTRIADGLTKKDNSGIIFAGVACGVYMSDWMLVFADLILFIMLLYFLWLTTRDRSLAFKMPLGSKWLDPNNGRGGKKGKSEGILYLGNVEKTNEEVWFTNSDIRTHILYLGTTGAGKTEGLKSLVTNAMAWGSGFVYVDGKADTDLWSSLSSLVRRFGRDDDLLVLNYMTGNSDVQAPSNTMNPFSSGSASYLTNMLVSLMPESGGDNAMWKERAVSLVGSMMPVLTWKRDNQEIPMSVRTIRDYLSLNNVIKLARDDVVPAEIRAGMTGYLDTLPGFIGEAYDDEGKVKPPGPDTPQYNTETASQQHGYLAMQFTRSLQSLGDDYGYIFDTQAADVDMVDVVLNRRILIVLVPALEKSGDEVANLGKIVASSIKGMMGSTLGSTVEGASESVIENKPTHSSTPFMTVFDEVGYYVAEGMAVMAAQARSLGFSLVFAGQDLPAMKKRVREEAQSITANCNIKLFGKLEDPTETKDFFEKTVGSAMVTEVSGFQTSGGSMSYHDTKQAGVQLRPRASYDGLRGFKEGQAVVTFGETVVDCAIFYSNPGFAKAMRVTRFMTLPPADETIIKHAGSITKLRDLMVNKTWTAIRADVAVETSVEIAALHDGFVKYNKPSVNPVEAAIAALVGIHALSGEIPAASGAVAAGSASGGGSSSGGGVAPAQSVKTEPAAPVEKVNPMAQKPPVLTATRPGDVEVKPIETPQPQSSAKPSVFGSKPDASPTQPAAPQTKPPAAGQPIKADSPAKPSVFGAKKETPVTPPQTTAPVQTPEKAKIPSSPAKPAIFGAKPDAPVDVAQEEKSDHGSDAMKKAADSAKASLFGSDAEKPEVSKADASAKPAIFGAKPQESTPPVVMETPEAEPVVKTPEVPEADTSPAKPAIFGAKPQESVPPVAVEAPSAAPLQTKAPKTDTPAKPAIFQKKPNDDAQE
ncbi:MAG: TraM recognition domain-containing protein [Alphaproteobacteria bacterium]